MTGTTDENPRSETSSDSMPLNKYIKLFLQLFGVIQFVNWDEKKIVINYFQSLYLKEKKYGGFIILNEMYAENKAIKKYEELSIKDRELILKRILHN